MRHHRNVDRFRIIAFVSRLIAALSLYTEQVRVDNTLDTS
jgi:hypothetical protein